MASPVADLSDEAVTSIGSASPLSNEPEPEASPPPQQQKQQRKQQRKPRAKKDPVAQREAYLARRREIKARARSRQKETASTLTEQYALLQKQLQAALATYKDATRAQLEQRLVDQDHLRQLWDEYVAALDLSQAITRENELLVERMDEFVLFECRLLLAESEFNAEQEDATRWRSAHSLLHRRGYWTQFMDEHDAPFYYECHRESDCNVAIRNSYQSMQQDIQAATAREWSMSGGCFGWQGYGNIDATDAAVVRFQFRKRLRRNSSVQLMEEMTKETSRIFHSSTLYARLYGMRMESQVMQRVDDHTSVILQSLSDAYRVLSLRSFMLFTCVGEQLPDGRRVMTILNTVIPPREQDVVMPFGDPHRILLYMTDCLIYMRMEQVDDEHLDVTYGGHAHCMSPDLAKVCVIESVSSFFRWVQQVIPERLVAFN